MKKLILISGDLAAGKSTVARALSRKHKIPCFIKDEMKEIGCDTIGFKNREENRAISKTSMLLMIYSFNEIAKSGQDVILEANFRAEEIDEVLKIAKENDYKIIPFFLYGDTKVLFERFLERLPHRNPAHTTLHLEEDITKYEKVIDDFREFSKNYDFKFVDITNLNREEALSLVENSYLNL